MLLKVRWDVLVVVLVLVVTGLMRRGRKRRVAEDISGVLCAGMGGLLMIMGYGGIWESMGTVEVRLMGARI